MKIALVCPYNVGRAGGVLEVIKNLRHGLVQQGHDVIILTPQPREMVKKSHLNDDGIIFLGTGTEFRAPTHTSLQLSVAIDTVQIEKILNTHKFDIIHFHEPWVPVVSRQILSRSESVNIATFHAVVPETIVSRSMAKVVTPYALSILRYLDAFTAVSEAAAGYVRSLSDQPIEIIPNAIDLGFYTPAKVVKSKKTKTVLYVGRLEKRKGVKYLLQAFSLLRAKHADVRLIIAGDGPDKAMLQKLTLELGIKTAVDFKGFVDDDTKLKLLRSADLFCSPALYGESFGIVLLEAMATATVAVAGNNSGYDALMKDSGQLSIINSKDAAEFARRLEIMMFNERVRSLWLDWANTYVRAFAFDNITERYEELYVRALARKRQS